MVEVTFTRSALDDLRHLEKAAQVVVLTAVERQLPAEPLKQTRNCKPLTPNDLSQWELRVGIHRLFYDVDEAKDQVTVKASGWKEHNKLFIRGEEHEL